ncbi:hypothetical protein HAV15_008623 [Penicillium sp. str. |nr:hypothetical protein HAV15_008623 [Penicillium sp. str. \
MQYTHISNPARLSQEAKSAAAVCIKNLSQWAMAVEEIRTWPEYSPQPLRTLPGFAQKVGVDQLFVKDESKRFGSDIGSFKALGAPYAVYKILAEEVYAKTGGRGLAYGAQVFGCCCVDYIHDHVSDGRADRMKNLGAVVIRVDGEYEASVARTREGGCPTSWSDFDNDVPQHVMNAYMVVLDEALSMIPAVDKVTHVFVCGGVGSIAAAIFQGFYKRFYEIQKSSAASATVAMPRFVVVEPSEADCLLQSAKSRGARESEGSLRTLMAGLACRTPSPAALKVLTWLASDFIAVPDSVAVDGMKALAYGEEGDIPVVCGESSAASMGIMLGSTTDPSLREKLGLNSSSQVVLFGLEGATDPDIYESLVGKSSQAVFEAQDGFVVRD